MSNLPIRITVRVDFEDGSQHEYEVRTPDAVTPPAGGFWPEGVVTRDVRTRMDLELARQRELDALRVLLRTAADDDELDVTTLGFAVITAGRRVTSGIGMMVVKTTEVTYYPFEKGEIIILPEDGYREPFGSGRSTAKYSVVTEWFGRDYEAAKRRSAEVIAAPSVDGFAPPR